MKIKNLISIFTGLILSASCMVNASLIEADFLGTNDGFYDTETELYWVDVNQFSAGTIDDMAAQAASMGATLGTKDQIKELFGNVDNISSFFSVGGTKWNTYIWGFYNDEISNSFGGQAFMSNTGAQAIIDNRGTHDNHRFLGAWATYQVAPALIIKQRLSAGPSLLTANSVSVPEPSTIAILALGMIGLASRRLKK